MSTIELDASAHTCTCGGTAVRIASPFAAIGFTEYAHAYLCESCSSIEFAPADPRRSSIRVTIRPASTPCTSCHGPIGELLNPYYGVKLAMSPNVRFCTECDQA